MKTKLTLLIFFFILLGCKKNKTTPQPQPVITQSCNKQSEVLSGKYVTYGTLVKDTITITYTSLNCPDQNSNTYLCKGLYKAVSDYSTTNLLDKDYNIISNESQKTGSSEYSIELYLSSSTTLMLTNPISLTFKKL